LIRACDRDEGTLEAILLRYNAARDSDYIMGFVGAQAREYEGGVVGGGASGGGIRGCFMNRQRLDKVEPRNNGGKTERRKTGDGERRDSITTTLPTNNESSIWPRLKGIVIKTLGIISDRCSHACPTTTAPATDGLSSQ
jgi:hypothetical protein